MPVVTEPTVLDQNILIKIIFDHSSGNLSEVWNLNNFWLFLMEVSKVN
jgi:hypothetical protein